MPISDYDPTITAAADRFNLDPKFLRAILMQENAAGDPRAVSRAGALGLGQLMPGTARGLGVNNPLDPTESIYGAAKYLDTALSAEGKPELAALYYHGGPGWRGAYGPESQRYVPGVAKNYVQLASAAAPPGGVTTTPPDDDPLKLLPPAPAAQGGAAPEDDPLKLLPPAPEPPPPPPPAEAMPRFDDQGRQIGPNAPEVQAAQGSGAGARIWGAIKNAWEENPHPLLTPEARAAAENAPTAVGSAIGKYITNPLETIEATALRAGLAGGAGLKQGVYEAGSAVGGDPLGRDLATALDVLPAVQAMPFVPGIKLPGPEAPVRTAKMPDGKTVVVPRDFGDITKPGEDAAIPKPAGAQITPPQLATFTSEETAAYRASAEGRKLMENQEIGVPDRNAYIPGVTVSAAEQELKAELARELKSAGLESPEVSQDIKATAQRNDTLRREHMKDTTGDEVSVHNEEQAQKTDIEEAKPKVFGADNVQGPVSMEPLVKQIDDTRSVPENRQNPELQKVLGDLRERLTNPDGSPRQMSPQEAWGLRRSIDRQTSKRMSADDPALHFEGHQLRTVSDTLDGEIEKMAPGYADMINTYKTHAQKIEAMEVLQDKTRAMLSQTTTPLRFSDFQRFMKNVVDMRRTGPTDLNPYKSITDAQMDRLWRVRDDLRRVATASELARAPGSDTVPNILDLLRRHAGEAAIHGVANYIAPGWGSFAVQAVKQATAPAMAARAAAQLRARAQELLHPPNQLQDPDAAP